MSDRSGFPEPTAQRCARRALRDAAAWGAELVVLKGDVTNHGWHGQWSVVRDLLADAGLPAIVVAGNHDVDKRREIGAGAACRRCGRYRPCRPRGRSGIWVAAPLHVVDLPGIRIVTVDSSQDTRSTGSLRGALPDLLDALADADRPALVCIHHCLDRWPVPSKYPRGITWPESQRVLAAIRNVKTDVPGHDRALAPQPRPSLRPARRTEVASTKDYPGVWAGYAVHEGGIMPGGTPHDPARRHALDRVLAAGRWAAPGAAMRPAAWPTAASPTPGRPLAPLGGVTARASSPSPSSGPDPGHARRGRPARPAIQRRARRGRTQATSTTSPSAKRERPVVAGHVDLGELATWRSS